MEKRRIRSKWNVIILIKLQITKKKKSLFKIFNIKKQENRSIGHQAWIFASVDKKRGKNLRHFVAGCL